MPAFSKNILACVSGLSPQIITETLYALAHREDPFQASEIHMMTTKEGADRAKLTLLGEPSSKGGYLKKMASDYPEKLGYLKHVECFFHVITDEDGNMLDDIKTDKANLLAADIIVETTRNLVSDYGDDSRIHFSVAGGRKTMGVYIALSAIMLGRLQDEISHVLVEEGFEGHPDFFYPTPEKLEKNVIYTRNQKPLDTAKAKVELSYIPFPRVLKTIDKSLVSEKQSFRDLVEKAQDSINRQLSLAFEIKAINLDITNPKNYGKGEGGKLQVYINEEYVHLSPAALAFLYVFAEEAKEGRVGFVRPNKASAAGRRLVAQYNKAYELATDKKLIEPKTMKGVDFDRYLNLVKDSLQKSLGEVGAEPYLIKPRGRYYKVGLESSQIELAVEVC